MERLNDRFGAIIGTSSHAILLVIKLTCMVLYLSHCLACAWYYIGSSSFYDGLSEDSSGDMVFEEGEPPPRSWLTGAPWMMGRTSITDKELKWSQVPEPCTPLAALEPKHIFRTRIDV